MDHGIPNIGSEGPINLQFTSLDSQPLQEPFPRSRIPGDKQV